VELAAVRCPHCYALHFTGARFCARCGQHLELEPLLDASDAPCPRCAKPLRAAQDGGVFECGACGGLFVDHAAFAALAADREAETKPFAAPPRSSTLVGPDVEVHYVKCPVCAEVMNRLNFGRRSGVIVDVCKLHGTWFDAGELTRVLEWIAAGGWIDARARERQAHAEENARLRAQHSEAAKSLLAKYHAGSRTPNHVESTDILVSMLKFFFRDE
jgi:Zn-finger nucleic acid-binding protein